MKDLCAALIIANIPSLSKEELQNLFKEVLDNCTGEQLLDLCNQYKLILNTEQVCKCQNCTHQEK